MKHKIVKKHKTERHLEISIDKQIVAEEMERICRELAKKAKVAGYRPGKAPLEVIQKQYEKEIADEAMHNLVTGSLGKAIKESKISMAGDPAISALSFDDEGGVSYKAMVNVMPEVSVKRYKGLKLNKKRRDVTDKEVDEAVDYFRQSNASYKTKDSGANNDDYVICDMDCLVDGESSEKKENIWLPVDDKSFIPAEVLKGSKAGDVRKTEKVLPEDYSRSELAGKKASFDIRVKEIKEKVLPEMTDELVKTLPGIESVKQLRETVKNNLEANAEREMKMDLENQAIDILVKENSFDVPEFMVENQLKRLSDDMVKRMSMQGLPVGNMEKRRKDFSEKMRPDAEKQVKTYFILSKITQDESVQISDEDYAKAFAEMAASGQQSAGEIKKYYEEHGFMEELENRLKVGRMIDVILSNATVS